MLGALFLSTVFPVRFSCCDVETLTVLPYTFLVRNFGIVIRIELTWPCADRVLLSHGRFNKYKGAPKFCLKRVKMLSESFKQFPTLNMRTDVQTQLPTKNA
jgi:hypothetical protein